MNFFEHYLVSSDEFTQTVLAVASLASPSSYLIQPLAHHLAGFIRRHHPSARPRGHLSRIEQNLIMKRLVTGSRNCRDEQRKIRLHVLGFNRYCQMPIARTVLCPDVELPESVAARIAIGAGMRTVEAETIQSGE